MEATSREQAIAAAKAKAEAEQAEKSRQEARESARLQAQAQAQLDSELAAIEATELANEQAEFEKQKAEVDGHPPVLPLSCFVVSLPMTSVTHLQPVREDEGRNGG